MQKRKLKEATFKAGDKATVVDYGTMSNKVVTVVDQKEIKTDGRGVPINVSGAYKEANYKTHVPVKTRDGKFSLIPKKNLKKNEPKQESKEPIIPKTKVRENQIIISRKRLKEGNRVSDKLPGVIDEFLQDIAQYSHGNFSYKNILDFSEIFNSKDISILNKWRKQSQNIEDEEFEDFQNKIIEYVKQRLNSVKESTKTKQRNPSLLEQRLKRLEEAIGIKEARVFPTEIAKKLIRDEDFMSLRTREQIIWLESQEELDRVQAKEVLELIDSMMEEE